jgi:hypothetical protein
MVDTGAVTRRSLGSVRVVCGAVAVAALAAACSGTGYSYIKNSDDRTYFRVPDQWTLYDEDALTADLAPREREAARETSWQVGFDASPKPSLRHVLDVKSKHPTGFAVVQELDFDAADTLSLMGLRNAFFDVDVAVQNQAGEIITYETLELDGGFHGFHLVADLVADGGRTATLDQTTVIDQATSKMYALIIMCAAQCYADNSDKIDRVVGSWTVEK